MSIDAQRRRYEQRRRRRFEIGEGDDCKEDDGRFCFEVLRAEPVPVSGPISWSQVEFVQIFAKKERRKKEIIF